MLKVLGGVVLVHILLPTISVAGDAVFYTSEYPASVLAGLLKCGECQQVPRTKYFLCEATKGTVKEKGDVYVFHCPGGTAYIHKSQVIKILPKWGKIK